MLTLAEREAARERFRVDTPFWAGGVYRNPDGTWHKPGPSEFQGCAKIRDKAGRIVPAIAHDWQLEFDDALESQRLAGKPQRAIILKARRLGFSTWTALKFLQKTTQIPDYEAVVVAQDVDTGNTIIDMAKRAHARLPTEDQLGMGINIRPSIIKQSDSDSGTKYMIFGEPSSARRRMGHISQSLFEVDTPGNGEGGRGKSPNAVHLSEVGRWTGAQANKKILAMLEAVAYVPESIVVMESTANGLNHFYRRWMAAKAGSLDPDSGEAYVPIFIPWWRDKQLVVPFASPDARLRFMDGIGSTAKWGEIAEDERMLADEYGCTPEQLLWRRMKISEHPDSKSVNTFNQENPYSDEAAFIGSGQSVIPRRLIAKGIKAAMAAPEPVRGSLRVPDDAWKERRSRAGVVRVPQSVLWVPEHDMSHVDHELLVWEHPVKAEMMPPETPDDERADGAYVIGSDIAEGEVNTFSEGDYHSIQVFDHRTGMQVAKHRSRMDLHLLPLWMLEVAIYYNNARLAPEVNSIGTAVADTLHKDLRYPFMFKRKRIDRLKQVEEDRPGWKTEANNKPAMVSTLSEALDSDTAGGLRDVITAKQMQTYVADEKGKWGAQPGEYDDDLMAAMIALRVMALTRPPGAKKGKKGPGWRPRDPVSGY